MPTDPISSGVAVNDFIVRQRIYAALNVPPAALLFLHVWATSLEGRQCGAEILAHLAGRPESATGMRQSAARFLDWYTKSGLNFGDIERRRKFLPLYGRHLPNEAVAWTQQQIAAAPDHNPITALDRFVTHAIKLFSLSVKPEKKEKRKKAGGVRAYRDRSCIKSDTYQKTSLLSTKRRTRTYKHGPLLERGEWAIALARDVFEVFPCAWSRGGVCSCWRELACKAPAKHPYLSRWQQVATRFEPLIHDHWIRHPHANIGIKTGTQLRPGLFLMALDVDVKTFGPGARARLEDELGPLPETRRHTTGSGGYHDFFGSPVLFQSKSGLLGCGLDVKCLGGFVVGPGSQNAQGGAYKKANDLPIARLPKRWADWIQRVWDKTVTLVPVGERHRALTEWCGAMIGKDHLSREAAIHVLKHRRDKRCVVHPQISDDEVAGIVDYCMTKEAQGRIAAGRAA